MEDTQPDNNDEETRRPTESTVTYSEHERLMNQLRDGQFNRMRALELAASAVAPAQVIATAQEYLSFLSEAESNRELSERELKEAETRGYLQGYFGGYNEDMDQSRGEAERWVIRNIRFRLAQEYGQHHGMGLTAEGVYNLLIGILDNCMKTKD